ncbi:MAG TPA: hypothetical protein DCX61_08520 [Gemmatimonadetes bacterium]|nr:hypothetical protein [Gemmatimonadota bacterium]
MDQWEERWLRFLGGRTQRAAGDDAPRLEGVRRSDRSELEKQTGRSIAPSAVYVTLRRLEKKGLLTSSMVPTRRALSVDPVSMLRSD